MTRLVATLSIILVALLLLTGWLVWYGPSSNDQADDRLALANNSLVGGTPQLTETDTEPAATIQPRIATQKGLHVVVPDRADILTLTRPDQLVVYNQESGLLSTLDPLSSKDQLSPLAQINPGAKSLIWSSDYSKLIARYISTSIYYDFETGATHTYPSAINGPVFDFETGNTIIYSYIDDERIGHISRADRFVDSFKNITRTRLQNVQLKPLTESVIALQGETASSRDRSSLGLLQKNTGELKTLVAGYEHLETLWAPSHTQLLYSVVKPTTNTVTLYYLNAATGARRELPVSTIASKCTWQADEQHILCAVGEQPITGDAYHALTNDRVVRINPLAQTLTVETIIPATSLDIKNLIFSEFNNTLFMNDARSSGVYRFVIE